MGVIWKGEGIINSTLDAKDHFNGKIGIEIRGSSSQSFPKKSYGFETWNEDNDDTNVALMGFPAESDWVLYGPYSDKSLIRNVLTYVLGAQLGNYAPRCRFVELFLNNEYRGVYVFIEKIKRDKNRVAISKLTENDIDGEDLTGGYIIKIDKTTGSGGDGWSSLFENSNGKKTFYQYEYPDQDDILPVQKQYIQNYIGEFESAVHNRDSDETTGYPAYIDEASFIDFILMNELAKNIDGYRLSTFLHKNKNGKLVAGPLWDFNLAYGNADYYEGWKTTGLQLYVNMGGSKDFQNSNPFWWLVLAQEQHFAGKLKCRWKDLRNSLLSDDHLAFVVDSLVNLLGNAPERNFETWNILNKRVWPNYYVGGSWDAEINWLKNWLKNRAQWLDAALPGSCIDTTNKVSEKFVATVTLNLFTEQLIIKTNAAIGERLTFQLYSINGSLLEQSNFMVGAEINRVEMESGHLYPGIYLFRILNEKNNAVFGKLVKIR